MGAAGCKEAIKVWDFSGMEGGRPWIFTDQNMEEEQERKRGDSEVKRRRRR